MVVNSWIVKNYIYELSRWWSIAISLENIVWSKYLWLYIYIYIYIYIYMRFCFDVSVRFGQCVFQISRNLTSLFACLCGFFIELLSWGGLLNQRRLIVGFICLHWRLWLSNFYYFPVGWLSLILNLNGTYVFRLLSICLLLFFLFFLLLISC